MSEYEASVVFLTLLAFSVKKREDFPLNVTSDYVEVTQQHLSILRYLPVNTGNTLHLEPSCFIGTCIFKDMSYFTDHFTSQLFNSLLSP